MKDKNNLIRGENKITITLKEYKFKTKNNEYRTERGINTKDAWRSLQVHCADIGLKEEYESVEEIDLSTNDNVLNNLGENSDAVLYEMDANNTDKITIKEGFGKTTEYRRSVIENKQLNN